MTGEPRPAAGLCLDLDRARRAVAPYVIRTPLVESPSLGNRLDRSVHLKLENLQVTGSFKVRGAASRMDDLTQDERGRGVVACSSGNHGRAVARIARLMDVAASICLPEWVDPLKLQGIRDEGARVVLADGGYDEAEAEAFRIREKEGRTFVHPFDDPLVIAGQGTLGLEVLEDLPEVKSVLVPLSGGGLVAGVAWALRAAGLDARVIAVSAARARVMVESLRAGAPVQMAEEETLAGALSGGIGAENRWTLRLVEDLVDDHVTVTEPEIRGAVAWAFRRLRTVVEGGGAVALAALLAGRLRRPADAAAGGATGTPAFVDTERALLAPGPVAVVLTGGNLDPGRLRSILAAG